MEHLFGCLENKGDVTQSLDLKLRASWQAILTLETPTSGRGLRAADPGAPEHQELDGIIV